MGKRGGLEFSGGGGGAQKFSEMEDARLTLFLRMVVLVFFCNYKTIAGL